MKNVHIFHPSGHHHFVMMFKIIPDDFSEARFKRVAGSWGSIKLAAKRFGKSWFQGKPPKPKPLSTE